MPIVRLTAKRNQRDLRWPSTLLADDPEPSWPRIEAAVRSMPGDRGPLVLTGGEPTLRRDLCSILTELTRAFPERDLVLLTNCRLFYYEKVCDELARVESRRLTVEAWIASIKSEVHDRFVGVNESFNQASKGIRQLLARGLHVRVRVIVGRHNVDHLSEIAACIPDSFPGLDSVVWDVAASVDTDGVDMRARPNEVGGFLESAINLLPHRQVGVAVVGMPLCALSEKFWIHLDRTNKGAYRPECAPCQVRDECPGLLDVHVADTAFRVRPVVPRAPDDILAEYAAYVDALLSKYVPPSARNATSVLDAMCGSSMHLEALRRFFSTATRVQGTDIAFDAWDLATQGTSLFLSDLQAPGNELGSYAFITLFRPPGEPEGLRGKALVHLLAALEPGGHLLVVLAEHTDVPEVLRVVDRTDVSVVTSEPNALRTMVEPEHKWVVVCRKDPSVG